MNSIESLAQAISVQSRINAFLAQNGIKDLVGDYGEILVHKALGGDRAGAVNQGFDLHHNDYGRIEVKTRKYELKQDGAVKKEHRAVGFKGKENGFDWMAHVVLNVDFSIEKACLVSYQDVWPKILETTGKVGFSTSFSLPSSVCITEKLRQAQSDLGFVNHK